MTVDKKKITLNELLDRLRDIDIDDQEFVDYFIESEEFSSGLSPVMVPNPKLVEDDGLEGGFFLGRFNNIARWRRNKRYKRRIKNWDGIRVVAEGDSWFQYPFRLKDVIDQLNDLDHFQYAIYGLSAAGDLLKDIVKEDEITEAVERENPHILLLSGGGNDMVGDERMAELVHKYNGSRKPENYPNEKFDTFLSELENLYRRLFDRLLRTKPHLKIFCHGYDFAIPADGKWLGKPLAKAKIVKQDLQREIVAEMINRFNQRMLSVVADYSGAIFHVDCRSIVEPANQWHDELHPTNEGYFEVAKLFDDSIQRALRAETGAPRVSIPSPISGTEDNSSAASGSTSTVDNIKQLNNSDFVNLVFKRAYRNNISPNLKPPASEYERKQLEKDIEQFFEKVHKGADFLPSSFLEKGVKKAQAVCRIVTDESYGSGFLIGNRDFIMTNNHVLDSAARARVSIAQFDYDEDEDNYQVEFDPDRLFITNQALDFTIVACKAQPLPANIEPIPLLQDPETVTRGERVNIIQHPRGRRQEISLHDNKVTYVYDKVIRYTTDTEGGSSGSPVFNNQWDLVALHHAGWPEADGAASNEGIRMTAIVQYLLESSPQESSSAFETLVGSITDLGAQDVASAPKKYVSAHTPARRSGSKSLTINLEGDIDELTIRLR